MSAEFHNLYKLTKSKIYMSKVSKFLVYFSVVAMGCAGVGGGIAAFYQLEFANKRYETKDDTRYADTDGFFGRTIINVDKKDSDVRVDRTDCPHFEGEGCSYFDQSGDGTLDSFVIDGHSGISGRYGKADFFDYQALHFQATQDYHKQLRRFGIKVPSTQE